MDPINIIAGLNVIATFSANLGGAKKGLISSISVPKERPKTYLQKLPLTLSMLTLVALILAVFKVGTMQYDDSYKTIRVAGLALYIFFSWVQIISFKRLGKNYSTEVLINKDHQLVTTGPYKLIRHPQYISQILLDIGGGLATLSYIILPLMIIEIPFLILRAKLEDRLLAKTFKENFDSYKKKSGFMLPFVG